MILEEMCDNWRKLGVWHSLVLILGCIYQGLFLGLLYALWRLRGDTEVELLDHGFLSTIILRNLTLGLVESGSSFAGIFLTLQLKTCTSLAAAFLVESGMIPRRSEYHRRLTSIRYYASGPLSLLKYHRLMRARLTWIVGIQLALWIAVGLGVSSRFISVSLALDLGSRTVKGDAESFQVSFADSSGLFTKANGRNFWSISHGMFPTFGESRLSESILGPELSDSGSIQRAFLPFLPGERARLRRYSGPAIVQETRTICVPVSLNASIGLYEEYDQLTITGTASWDRSNPGDPDIDHIPGPTELTSEPLPFTCPFLYVTGDPAGVRGDSSQLALCRVQDGDRGGLLMISAAGRFLDWYPDYRKLNLRKLQRLKVPDLNGWSHFEGEQDDKLQRSELILNATVCNVHYRHSAQVVIASTALGVRPDPSLVWLDDEQRWTTDDVLTMMGASNRSTTTAERGIFELEGTVQLSQESPLAFSAIDDSFDRFLQSELRNNSLIFCTTCITVAPGPGLAHPASVLIMQAVLNRTSDPALVLSSLWTIWAQDMYYSSQSEFDYTANLTAEVVFSKEILMPTQSKGVWFVRVMIGFSIVIVAFARLFFAPRITAVEAGLEDLTEGWADEDVELVGYRTSLESDLV